MTTPPSLSIELGELVHRLDQIEDYALLHGDPCPGNDIHTTEGIHFVDFEQASLGNGITELAYLRIGFPTCLCAIAPPEALLVQAENAYRSEWRLLTGTDVHGELADVCGGWLIRGDALVARAHRGKIDHLARIPDQDWTWGTATARERLLHRLAPRRSRSPNSRLGFGVSAALGLTRTDQNQRVVAKMSIDRPELSELVRCCNFLRDHMLARWPDLQPLPVHRPPSRGSVIASESR